MKKTLSIILSVVLSLGFLTACGGSGTVETEGKKDLSENGGGTAYVFDIDKISSYVVESHKNLITICAYSRSNNNSFLFTDVYVEKDTVNGSLGIDNSKGFSGVSGTSINNNTNVKILDNNCYVRIGRKKNYMKNVNIKLINVPEKNGKKGKASFTFDWVEQ